MGYVSFTDGRSYARVAQKIGTNQFPGYPWDTYDWVYGNDGTFSFYSDYAGHSLISHPMYIGDLVGVLGNEFDKDRRADYRTFRPTKQPWIYEEDRLRYPANIATSINEVLCQDNSPDYLKEHQTSHAKYSGELRDRFTDLQPIYQDSNYQQTVSYFGRSVSKLELTPGVVGVHTSARATGVADNGQRIFELGVGQVPYPPGYETHVGCDYLKFFHEIASYIEAQGEVSYTPHPWWTMYTRGMSHAVRFDGYTGELSASYEYEMRADSPYGIAYVKFYVHIDYRFRFAPGGAVNGLDPAEHNLINHLVFDDYNGSTVTVLDWGGTNPVWGKTINPAFNPPRVVEPWKIVRGEEHEVPPLFFSFPYQAASNVTDRFGRYRRYGGNNPNLRHDVFMKMTRDDLPNVRPSSFLAASNALDSNLEVLRANNVENLSQLSGILGLLPDLGSIPALAAKAANGNPSAILDLIDYVTDAVIRFRFAQAPTAGDLKEVLSVGDIKQRMLDLTRARRLTVYGQFRWDFPSELNYVGPGLLTLETRSKIRLVTDFSSLMTSLISLNSVGLLPSLSRVWETLPFTFVVDWFTNMSKRMKLVDNQALFFAIRSSWTVYSYKFRYYPAHYELGEYGLEVPPLSGEPFNISAYYREFTRTAPRLRDSRYDFLAVTGVPNLITVASLMWQKGRN